MNAIIGWCKKQFRANDEDRVSVRLRLQCELMHGMTTAVQVSCNTHESDKVILIL